MARAFKLLHMLKVFLLSLLLIAFSFLLGEYKDITQSYKVEDKNLGMFDRVRIKSYSQKGIDWTIEGKALRVEGAKVLLEEALLTSESATLRAKKAFIDMDTRAGFLEGDVEFKEKTLPLLHRGQALT